VDWNLLSDVTSQALAAALEGSAARHRAIAQNLANLDTPGFIRSDLNFEEALAVALERARQGPHRAFDLFASLPLRPQQDRSSPARADGNNVDVDREMVLLCHPRGSPLMSAPRSIFTIPMQTGKSETSFNSLSYARAVSSSAAHHAAIARTAH